MSTTFDRKIESSQRFEGRRGAPAGNSKDRLSTVLLKTTVLYCSLSNVLPVQVRTTCTSLQYRTTFRVRVTVY